jgi:hypothetical protein
VTTTESLEQQLGAALGLPLVTAKRASLDARFQSSLASASARPRRRRLIGPKLALVGLLLLVPGVIAAGAMLSTEDPYGLTDAAGFQAELDSAKAITPIPAGATWPDFLRADPSVSYSAGGGRAWVEIVSMCLWETDWLHARAAHDTVRETAARTTILGFPSWWSTDSIFFRPAGARADYLAPIVAGVRLGDPTAVTRDVELNCAGMSPFVAP